MELLCVGRPDGASQRTTKSAESSSDIMLNRTGRHTERLPRSATAPLTADGASGPAPTGLRVSGGPTHPSWAVPAPARKPQPLTYARPLVSFAPPQRPDRLCVRARRGCPCGSPVLRLPAPVDRCSLVCYQASIMYALTFHTKAYSIASRLACTILHISLTLKTNSLSKRSAA